MDKRLLRVKKELVMNIDNDLMSKPETEKPLDQNPESQEEINFAPFSLMSCRKVFNSRSMPRKRLHTFIYSIIMLGLILVTGLISITIAFMPRELTRFDIISLIISTTITIGIFSTIKTSIKEKKFHGWAYCLNLFIAINIRANIYSLLVLSTILGGALYLKIEEINQWYIDDIFMMTNIIFILLFWDGSKYFRKES